MEETVIEFHDEQIRCFGGLNGIGDPSGLSSAIFAPQNVYLYRDDATLFDVAAAYAYHISMSQAFIDGNKRTGLAAAIVFLKINGYSVKSDPESLFEWMISLHETTDGKAVFAKHLCDCSVRSGGFTQWISRMFSR